MSDLDVIRVRIGNSIQRVLDGHSSKADAVEDILIAVDGYRYRSAVDDGGTDLTLYVDIDATKGGES